MNPFQKASRSQVFLKLAITGPTGSGKTFSALRLAKGLIEESGKRIAFLDTENDSASLYSDDFDFDVMPIAPPFEAAEFAKGITAAVEAGYGAVIIDSASHFWKSILALKDKLDKRGGNSYTNWGEADKPFDTFMEAVLQSKMHVIFCMRSKMDYVLEDNGKGKQAPKRVGLAPIFRDGIEFEFTVVFDVAMDHNAQASKDRSKLFKEKIFTITEDTGKQIAAWLKTATPKPEPPKPEPVVQLTDEEAYNKNLLKVRDTLSKNVPEGYEAADFESAWSKMISTKCEDKKERTALEQFTLAEFRGPLHTYCAWAVSEVHRIAKGVAK